MKLNNLYLWIRQKPRIAFLMCLPLILMVACLIIYPFFYSIFLATLNKAETKFVGIDNFLFLFKRETFWLVVQQSIIFALVAVLFKAVIGFVAAHSINELPSKGQRKWRGMLLIPWVIPPALSTLGWWWLFEPTYSALNWVLEKLSVDNLIPSIQFLSASTASKRLQDNSLEAGSSFDKFNLFYINLLNIFILY